MASTTEFDCRYIGGDPRLHQQGPAIVTLQIDGVRIEVQPVGLPAEVVHIPKGSLSGVHEDEQRLGFEQAECEEEVVIDPDENLIRYTAVIYVKDPEGVLPEGFRVRLAFGNEYEAKVFAKRCSDAFQIAPF